MAPDNQTFEIRNGEPFCTKCNQPMLIRTMPEVFTIPVQSADVAFMCEKCGETVPYPVECRYFASTQI